MPLYSKTIPLIIRAHEAIVIKGRQAPGRGDDLIFPFLSLMSEPPPWCIIVNLQTCRDKAWKQWQQLLVANNITHTFYFTKSIAELSDVLQHLLKNGHKNYLFAGGDGTLHQGGNLLLHHSGELSEQLMIGVLPCGTGNDWIRTFGIRYQRILIKHLQTLSAEPLHVLKLEFADGKVHYAFNMVGGALDAAVVQSLDISSIRIAGALKYPLALLNALTKPHRWKGAILIDEKKITGDWLTLQAGFGKYCGGGMYVLPHAEKNKPALLLMKPKSIGKLIVSLPKLYNGKIADQKEAITAHFTSLEINHHGTPIPIEADGEFLGYTPVTISVEYGVMNRLASE